MLQTIHRFRSNGDEPSAALLENVIYAVSHGSLRGYVRALRAMLVVVMAVLLHRRRASK